mmetsp:Transcript_82751/g.208280  ORF Transcript_82751/g.208280 Transcript_82751/m.208280 type:complete len:388 (-) Transcript_82751:150-1313(-)
MAPQCFDLTVQDWLEVLTSRLAKEGLQIGDLPDADDPDCLLVLLELGFESAVCRTKLRKAIRDLQASPAQRFDDSRLAEDADTPPSFPDSASTCATDGTSAGRDSCMEDDEEDRHRDIDLQVIDDELVNLAGGIESAGCSAFTAGCSAYTEDANSSCCMQSPVSFVRRVCTSAGPLPRAAEAAGSAAEQPSGGDERRAGPLPPSVPQQRPALERSMSSEDSGVPLQPQTYSRCLPQLPTSPRRVPLQLPIGAALPSGSCVVVSQPMLIQDLSPSRPAHAVHFKPVIASNASQLNSAPHVQRMRSQSPVRHTIGGYAGHGGTYAAAAAAAAVSPRRLSSVSIAAGCRAPCSTPQSSVLPAGFMLPHPASPSAFAATSALGHQPLCAAA